MEPLTVTAEPTPNPEAMKFALNRAPFDPRHGQTFASADEALLSPLARALFAVPGVAGVFLLRDFVTVRRAPSADWSLLAPAVQRAILVHFAGES
jgi:hypothetical protein